MTSDAESSSPLSATKQALATIRDLKRRLAEAEAESGSREPIAIVAAACRFPRQSDSPEAYWRSLLAGTDEISELPPERWDLDAYYDSDPETPGKMYVRRGAFLEHLDLMDSGFFGVSPREATWMDPQQRLFLEVSWEVLERAGWSPDKLGMRTGVFAGWMHNDYQNEGSDSLLDLNPYLATGAGGSFLCGRLSYYLGIQGPSLALDTACSSSLVALHLACQSLRLRECDRALVGGVNAMVSPKTTVTTCKLRALSPKGESRAFDAAADGYVRGEGCGVVALRRLADAQRDGDPVLAVIRGSAVTHNGASSGLTAPNRESQERVIRDALRQAGIDPTDVDYLEAHGTGTELGDPIEMLAAAAVLGAGRNPDQPLLVGSVKTNIGHLEAAAGMAGIIKTVLCLQHGTIPRHLNFEVPNPHIPWNDLPVRIVTEPTSWPDRGRRIAGVSAFGMGGTNAHIVLEEAPAAAHPVPIEEAPSRPRVLVLSAKSPEALRQLAARYEAWLGEHPGEDWADVCFTAGTGRRHFVFRAALVAQSAEEARPQLAALAEGRSVSGLFTGQGKAEPLIGWQFTGQGSQYSGMGAGLYATEPRFRATMDACAEQLSGLRDARLLDIVFGDEETLNQTEWTQPALFSLHLALADLLESWGIVPGVVLGHSVGQFAASCLAGCMGREEGLRLIHHRGELTGQLPGGGAMAAIFAPAESLTERLARFPDLAVAAFNGTHVVVSGPEAPLQVFCAELELEGIRIRRLQTSHAFHSALLDPVLDEFERRAESVPFAPARCPLVCNVTGEVLPPDRILDGAYWRRQMREAVRFEQSIRSLNVLGCDVLLELGPQPVLCGMAAASWTGASSALIPSLQPGVPDGEAMMRMLARLFVHGVNPRFEAIFAEAPRTRLVLPTYPFQRERLWGIARPAAAQVAKDTQHPLLGAPMTLAGLSGERRFQSRIEPTNPRWLEDHKVFGDVVFPGAAFIDMALAAIGGRGVIENSLFESPLLVPGGTLVQTVHKQGKEGGSSLEVFSAAEAGTAWTKHFSAVTGAHELPPAGNLSRAEVEALCPDEVSVESFYEMFRGLGLEYGPEFRTAQSLRRGPQDVIVKLGCRSDYRAFVLPPSLLDGAFHALGVGLFEDPSAPLFLPVGIDRVVAYGIAPNDLWCHGHWEDDAGNGQRSADLVLFDDSGAVFARIEGLKLRKVSRSALRQLVGSGIERLIYRIDWRPGVLPEPATTISNWLIVRDRNRNKHPLTTVLERRGHRCVEVALSLDASKLPEPAWRDGRAAILADQADQWVDLLQRYFPSTATSGPLHGILWITGEDTVEEAVSPIGSPQTKVHCSGMIGMLRALRTLRVETLDRGLQLITRGAVPAEHGDPVHAAAAQFWGLARVLVNEHPSFRCRVTDTDDASLDRLADVVMTESWESQVAVRSGRIILPRLAPAKLPEARPGEGIVVEGEGTYLITGGLGMLGRRAAEWLARRGAGHVILVSRRPPPEDSLAGFRELERLGCQIHIKAADISDPASLDRLFAEIDQELPPLRGLIHAAGVLEDSLMVEQSWERFETVLAPKINGAWALHERTAGRVLDFFVLYSSAASVMGSPGQGNYATANAFLDGLAHHRVALGLPALSMNFGPWNEGMAAAETVVRAMALQGITPLTADDAHHCIDALFQAGVAQAMVLDVDWRRMRQRLPVQAPPFWDEIWPSGDDPSAGGAVLLEKLRGCPESARAELLRTHLQNELKQILSLNQLPAPETPLATLGLDSLMAVEIGTRLQQQVGTQYAIPTTVAFDYPSVAALTDHLLNLLRESEPPAVPAEPVREVATDDDSVVIIGMGCRFPGADDVNAYWRLLETGIDATGEIPADRWELERFYAAERTAGKIYTRRGGFLADIETFDPEFFGMSQDEACWTDPQHRLLLEVCWQALEEAAVAPESLVRASVGVFMGIMSSDFAQRCEQEFSGGAEAAPFQGGGLSHSAGVGRVSSFFGFEGPCLAIDTASSSSLVAICQAVRYLLNGECDLALAGGVNAILSPTNYLLLCKAGMLSPDGRCKSFSAAADGFGRGEGCGVVVLKRRADAERDGDRILAAIRGTAVSHNGSGGISAPSGRAQERLLRQALEAARLKPSQVHYLEAHGTATALGDSIELRAALEVLTTGRDAAQPLLIGSAKANIGHLEAAGGVSGLIKTVLAMEHGIIPPQIHCEEPTPHIPWDRVPAKLVREPASWPEPVRPIAGVTALGMSGTNAHVLLQGHPVAESPPSNAPERGQHLFVLSARSAEGLAAQAARFANWCAASGSVLADACFSAGVGRRHFACRAAILVSSADELGEALRDLATGVSRPGLHQGVAAATTPKIGWIYPSLETVEGGWELGETEPVFRASWDQCEQWLRAAPEPGTRSARFALQMALTSLWRSWGIDAEVVMGEGCGQLAAACAAGMMRWEDGLRLANQMDQGTDSAGLDALERLAASFDFLPPDKPVICQLTGEIVPVHRLWTGSYWRRFVSEPHRRVEAWNTLRGAGCDLLLQIGPPEIDANDSTAPVFSSLSPGKSGTESMLTALAELHVRGKAIDFRGFHAPWPRRKVSLPTYAFQRRRCSLR